MIKKIKGTLDILPEETAVWRSVEQTIRSICDTFGFEEIRFPTIESKALFQRGVGGTTDIVQKEMFLLADRDGNELALRPEGTACVVRSVVENGLFNLPMPLKLFYLTNFFRYEKPQAGRSREFYQFGVELFGTKQAAADATVIGIGDMVFRKLGIVADLHLNSIGCPDCRPSYKSALIDYFTAHKHSLCETCRERLATNPLRILDCKSPICSEIAQGAPKTIDYLCEPCGEHFRQLQEILLAMGIGYTVDPRIVRGLDYYVRTVFEFLSDDIGAQSTLCGGGRYDGLVEELDGPALDGIGFGMGLTRVILALQAKAKDGRQALPKRPSPLVYIGSMGETAATESIRLTHALRSNGIAAECDLAGRSLKAQMKYADKIGANYAVVLGGDELTTGTAELKNLRDGTKSQVALSDIVKILCSRKGDETKTEERNRPWQNF